MYSSNIFPPIFNQSYAPAFIYTDTCRIYFSLSKYNSISSLHHIGTSSTVDGVQVVVRDQKTNLSALNTTTYPSGIKLTTLGIDNTREGDDKYYIQIATEDIQDGFVLNKYYKVQIRLTEAGASLVPTPSQLPLSKQNYSPQSNFGIDNWLNANLNYFSEWSRVILIRGISTPVLSLDDYPSLNDIITIDKNDLDIVGSISFSSNSDSETLKSYSVKLFQNNVLLEDSGELDSTNNRINYSIKRYLQHEKTYQVKVQILTQNLYSWSSPQTIFFQVQIQPQPTLDVDLTYEADDRTGHIDLLISDNDDLLVEDAVIVIKRNYSKDDFFTWETIAQIPITQSYVVDILWHDYTIQPGVWYKYNIIYYNPSGVRTASIKTTNALMVHSEDIFLSANDKQLNVRFDPQITDIAYKTSQTVVETIGSQYPFIRRNGAVNYRSFSLSGTITCFMDLKKNLMKASKQDIYGNSKTLYDNYNQQNNITLFNDDIYERFFRQQVIKFLQENNVKLFRSTTQGNILVKLSNFSFSPNNQLSRQIYSFSCSVNQIAECNVDNLKKYNILNINKAQFDTTITGSGD